MIVRLGTGSIPDDIRYSARFEVLTKDVSHPREGGRQTIALRQLRRLYLRSNLDEVTRAHESDAGTNEMEDK